MVMMTTILQLLSPSTAEEHAIALLLQLRAEQNVYQQAQSALLKEQIQGQADSLHTLLHKVQLRASQPSCVNRAALFAETMLPIRHKLEVYQRFQGLQSTICESYPSNDEHFDWATHLANLQTALAEDEVKALMAVSRLFNV